MCCCNQTNGPHSSDGGWEVNSSSITSDVSDCMLYFVIWDTNLSNSNAIVHVEESKVEIHIWIQ